MIHIPVLTKEILKYLNLKPNENFIDATVGEGGHAIEILKRNGPKGLVLGIDSDPEQIKNAGINTQNFKKRIILANDSYANLKEIVDKNNFRPVNGILLDLGISSWQLEKSKKGFSFQEDEPLDMRYSPANPVTAEKIVNEYKDSEIEKVLEDYGEEKFAKQIVKKITERRKLKRIKSTFELKNIIINAVPSRYLAKRIDPATRTFQALRIAVNQELDNLKEFLPRAIEILVGGGRLVIISFHSLEDRMVKNFFKEKESAVKILTKKPVTAGKSELSQNPRSRSAKLRAIVKN